MVDRFGYTKIGHIVPAGSPVSIVVQTHASTRDQPAIAPKTILVHHRCDEYVSFGCFLHVAIFEWRQMPANSTLHFRGQAVKGIYEWQILAVFALCILGASLILALLLERRKHARADHALLLSEQKYARVFRLSPDAILLTRRSDGTILEANDRWEVLAGYNRDEARGRTTKELNLYVNVEHPETLISRLKRDGFERDFEAKLRLRNGVIREVMISGESITINHEPCILTLIHDITKQKESEEELQKLTSQLIHSQEEERQRLAAELHDSVGQGLIIIKNRALICLRNTSDREAVSEQLTELLATATATIEEMRTISHNLRPFELDKLGLIDGLKAMLDRISRSTTLRLSSDFDSIDGLLPRDAESGIYRIVQEGLTNVLKHAQATEARVALKRAGTQLIVTVTNNGKRNGDGNAVRASEKALNGGGFGLKGIAHRARMLGGTYDFHSGPEGAVLRVTAEVPEAGIVQ
jgi:PAS domain S-box-containing protein